MTSIQSPLNAPSSRETPFDQTDKPLRQSSVFERLADTRQLSLELARPLTDEDQMVQASDDASPTKWHLAHTTWFFESFILSAHLPGYKPFSDAFEYCFNSYYEAKGDRHPRASRGLLTRPSAQEVRSYRAYVDEALNELAQTNKAATPELQNLIELGINHEQQHQELLLTDILALFALQPLKPAYVECQTSQPPPTAAQSTALKGQHTPSSSTNVRFDGGIYAIGHEGRTFSYDNEGPRHDTLLRPFRMANRLITNAEWLAFMSDGGYTDHRLWLADGWAWLKANAVNAPGYWELKDGVWHQMTLHGLVQPNPKSPVTHISYYEADAFAKWAGARLPTETEWEVATSKARLSQPNTLATQTFAPQPAPAPSGGLIDQMFGDVWEWTVSPYTPYPGYRPPDGAVGEYNGKFMCSQQVLRGASCATAPNHSRPTYRNFFYPYQRWQFMGLRLAEDS
ncbi:MAG: ergothioneine biosynthesis protein EgtB [Pseudomonadota bacterium]